MAVTTTHAQEPLLACTEGQRKPVQVYSVFGKETVQTDGHCYDFLIGTGGGDAEDKEVMFVIRSSVWVNFGLFIAKLYSYLVSGSLAVLASLVDSAIDLLGQGVLMWTKHIATVEGRRGGGGQEYPIGRGRLEPVGVMFCSIVMGMASILVISTSTIKLHVYWGADDVPPLVLTAASVATLIFIIVLKAVLYVWCSRVSRKHPQNDSVKAIAQDNLNDVISNIAALLAPLATKLGPAWWIADPLAGIFISLYIICTWVMTGLEQVQMIVGRRADPEFLRKIQIIAEMHCPSMQLDQLCAYHFGPRYLVEVEVVMDESTTLRESHDTGITLQHKIETLDEVERCFVHIDYQLRVHDDHDPEVPIEKKIHGGSYGGVPRSAPSSDNL